ncbi:MAG: TspO/MBR family protein [Chitinophagales bacterium]
MYYARLFLFLFLNFGALAIGSMWTQHGVTGDWYLSLDKAPWTPPGWVFGAAWTLIMICLSVFMASLVSGPIGNTSRFLLLFAVQWITNVLWNYLFFHNHQPGWALLDILLVFLFVGMLAIRNLRNTTGVSTLWLLPYLLWLCIAISLNVYIVIKNG